MISETAWFEKRESAAPGLERPGGAEIPQVWPGISDLRIAFAPPPGSATMKSGAPQPWATKAVATAACTALTRSTGTSAMAEPPKPPPVIRAPEAPAWRATSTVTSSSSQETS